MGSATSKLVEEWNHCVFFVWEYSFRLGGLGLVVPSRLVNYSSTGLIEYIRIL